MTGSRKKLSDLPLDNVTVLLAEGRLALQTGELLARLQSGMADVARSLYTLYGQHPVFIDPAFADFHIEVRKPRNLRRWMRQQAEFLIDGEAPFEPLPREQAPALLEWGLNWAIASSCHQWLTIHAASLERHGQVVVLPAPPGLGQEHLVCGAGPARLAVVVG